MTPFLAFRVAPACPEPEGARRDGAPYPDAC